MTRFGGFFGVFILPYDSQKFNVLSGVSRKNAANRLTTGNHKIILMSVT